MEETELEKEFLKATRDMVTWGHCTVLIKGGETVYADDISIEEALDMVKNQDYIAVPF